MGKGEFICKTFNVFLRKEKMSAQVYVNKFQPCPNINELENLIIELMLISQITTFMFIFAKSKSAQFGIKRQGKIQKIQKIHSRTCDEGCLISFEIQICLSDGVTVCQQQIQKQIQIPNTVNKALENLIQVNPFYAEVRVDESCKSVSKECDLEL